MEEKKPEMSVDTGNENVPCSRLEDQLSALAQQLSHALQESAQMDEARRNQLDQRELALKKQEMLAKAKAEMEKRGLPCELAAGLEFENAEEMAAAVSALEDCFREAVQKGVEERLLSDAPKAQPLQPLSEMTDEDYYAAVYSRN